MTIERKITAEPWAVEYSPIEHDSTVVAYDVVPDSLPVPTPPEGEGWSLAAMTVHSATFPAFGTQEFAFYTWERVLAMPKPIRTNDAEFYITPMQDWANKQRLAIAKGGPMPTLEEWLNFIAGKTILGTFVGETFAVVQCPFRQGFERTMFFRDENRKWTDDRECDVSGCLKARAVWIHESALTLANLKELYP